MTVQKIAREDVVTASREQSAGNLATVMVEEEVGSVVVVDDDHPVGIVTDRDLMVEVLEPRRDPTEVAAEAVMTSTPETVHADTGIWELTQAMAEAEVRRMPVVGDDDELTGIVTLDDLVVLLTGEFENLARIVQAESPPY